MVSNWLRIEHWRNLSVQLFIHSLSPLLLNMWCSANKNVLRFIKFILITKYIGIDFSNQYSVIWKLLIIKNKHQCWVKQESTLTSEQCRGQEHLEGPFAGNMETCTTAQRETGGLNPQPSSCTAPQNSSKLFIHECASWNPCWTHTHTVDALRCPSSG